MINLKSSNFFDPWPSQFNWQDGFGCFTYAHSQLNVVAKYVLNQKEHHRSKSFREEYIEFLDRFVVPYEEKYLFEFYE